MTTGRDYLGHRKPSTVVKVSLTKSIFRFIHVKPKPKHNKPQFLERNSEVRRYVCEHVLCVVSMAQCIRVWAIHVGESLVDVEQEFHCDATHVQQSRLTQHDRLLEGHLRPHIHTHMLHSTTGFLRDTCDHTYTHVTHAPRRHNSHLQS